MCSNMGVRRSGVVDAVHLPIPRIPRNFRTPVPKLTMNFDWTGRTYEFGSKNCAGLEDRGGVAKGEAVAGGKCPFFSVVGGRGAWKILSWRLW